MSDLVVSVSTQVDVHVKDVVSAIVDDGETGLLLRVIADAEARVATQSRHEAEKKHALEAAKRLRDLAEWWEKSAGEI